MIDNKQLIVPLLNFEREGDFYMLYVFKRKKDFPGEESSNHQSVRTIKSYYIESIEGLEKRWEEIKMLCEFFKARAYIHVQKQNHADVGLDMIAEIARRMKEGVIRQTHVFDSIVGQLKTYEKRWIVDIDTKDEEVVGSIVSTIYECSPIGGKVLAVIPTKQGYHLITERFDSKEFEKSYPTIGIQKKNPTLLYLPNSLHNEE